MNKCYWIARVILIAIGIALAMVMLIRLFETASANPIVPYPDTFEFVWPSDVTQPEQLQLQCHDASGNIEYTNTIDRVSSKYFVGGQDIGDSFGLKIILHNVICYSILMA